MKRLLLALLLVTTGSKLASGDIINFDYSVTGTGFLFDGAATDSGSGPLVNIPVIDLASDPVANLVISLGSNFIDVLFDFAPGIESPLNLPIDVTLSNFQFPGGETLDSITFDAANSSGSDQSAGIVGTTSISFEAADGDLFNGGDGGSLNYRFDFNTSTVTAVPEPSSFAVCFIGGLAAWRIRRKRAA